MSSERGLWDGSVVNAKAEKLKSGPGAELKAVKSVVEAELERITG